MLIYIANFSLCPFPFPFHSKSKFSLSVISSAFSLLLYISSFLAICSANEMSALEISHIDLEAGSDVGAEKDDSGFFSDAEEGSCHSLFFSTTGVSYDEVGIVSESQSQRASSVSDDCSIVAFEIGQINTRKVQYLVGKVDLARDCRICHLGFDGNSLESGIPIELGCSCKNDLAVAHRHCAEQWFQIKGNKTCEICHSVARNVVGGGNGVGSTEESNGANTNGSLITGSSDSNSISTAAPSQVPLADSWSFWRGHRFLNFLLACVVFAFVISWLFHFNMPA